MKRKFYFLHDSYGDYLPTSGSFNKLLMYSSNSSRYVCNTKQIVWCMINLNTPKELFDAAWKKGLKSFSIEPYKTDKEFETDKLMISFCYETYRMLDLIISEMINNPKSKYYMYPSS